MNMNYIFPILLAVVFYFFILRPQMKEKKQFEKLLASLKKGDKVLTQSGIFGEVNHVENDRVSVKVADNVKIEFLKTSIQKVITEEKK
jgi:preprotein translocase subunit YajC